MDEDSNEGDGDGSADPYTSYSSYSSLLHSYSERQSDDDGDDGLAGEDRASMSERLTTEMREEEEEERRRQRRERDMQSRAQSERVEDAELDEQDRLREAGAQGLFGGDSMRREEDEDEEEDNHEQTAEARAHDEGAELAAGVQTEAADAATTSTPPQHTSTLGKRRRTVDSKVDSSPPAALPSVIAGSAPPAAPTRPHEFVVPDLPSNSSAKRRALPPFSLPSANLLPPPAVIANVSPISTADYAASANFSPAPRSAISSLPPPLSYTAAYAAPPSFPSYTPTTMRSATASIGSPPHSRSPSMPPLSPRASPRITWPPSSPRMDSIHSVSLRVEQWQRLGRVQAMMKTAHAHAAVSVVSAAAAGGSGGGGGSGLGGSLPRRLSTSSSVRLPVDSREPLLTIDRYLRRRYLLRILDSDMIVRGVVYNKTSVGLIITITQIETDIHSTDRTATIPLPTLSSQWPDSKVEDDMRELEELEIRGECHLSEIQGGGIAGGSGEVKGSGGDDSGGGGMLSGFDVGDCVRCLVISVDVHSEKVYLSMHNARLKGAAATGSDRLGPYRDINHSPAIKPLLPPTTHRETEGATQYPTISNLLSSLSTPQPTAPHPSTSTASTAPSPYSFMSTPSPASLPVPYGFPSFKRQGSNNVAAAGSTLSSPLSTYAVPSVLARKRRVRPSNYLQWLRSQPLFLNPAGLSILLTAYAINQHGSLSSPPTPPPALPAATPTLSAHLRQLQNTQWAKETVARGITLSRNGSYANAMRLYQHALEIEPNYVEAVVARGACWVLQGQLRRGKEEFERALEMDASNAYARKYLDACNERLKKEKTQRGNAWTGIGMLSGGKHPAVERKELRAAVIEDEEADGDEVEIEETNRTERSRNDRQREQSSGNSSGSGGSSGVQKMRTERSQSPVTEDRDSDRQREWVEID